MNVKGNLQGFELTGLVGENNHFNSHWMLERGSLLSGLFGHLTVKHFRRCQNTLVLS